ENFTLVDYKRHSPTSKTKVSDETEAKVSDILIEFSNSSSSTISLGTTGNGYQEIRYLSNPKRRDIYYKLKKKHPEMQLSLTDFKENFKIGGGQIETTRDFYQKSQIPDLCFYVLSHSGDLVRRRSEFQEFEEINLLSNSGPHFKNVDYLYSARLELPQIFPSKKFKLNYFMENHGKSDVGGHFGVLSRWFKEIERNRYLPSIGDLVSVFREKAQVSRSVFDSSRNYNFQICRKDAICGLRIQAKVSSRFRNYPSFYLGGDGLMAYHLSLPDPSKYFNIDFRIKVKRDIRTNKYAPDRPNPLGSDTDIMGSTSRNTQRIRVEMLRGIGVSLSS
ncbi:hypothetical protein BB560_006286, partial [Smittium megazygosporum]